MKGNFWLKFCLFAIGTMGLFVVVKDFAATSPAPVPTPVSQLVNAQGQLLVPNAGQQYSLGYLFDLINHNNPSQTSNFSVPAAGTSAAAAVPITHPQCWPSSGVHLTMGIAADSIGLTIGELNSKTGSAALRNTMVTLQQDPVLIAALSQPYAQKAQNPAAGVLTVATQVYQGKTIPGTAASYQKILLYFLYTSPKNGQVYRCYLNDVLPPPVVVSAMGVTYPAYNILVKWAVPAN